MWALKKVLFPAHLNDDSQKSTRTVASRRRAAPAGDSLACCDTSLRQQNERVKSRKRQRVKPNAISEDTVGSVLMNLTNTLPTNQGRNQTKLRKRCDSRTTVPATDSLASLGGLQHHIPRRVTPPVRQSRTMDSVLARLGSALQTSDATETAGGVSSIRESQTSEVSDQNQYQINEAHEHDNSLPNGEKRRRAQHLPVSTICGLGAFVGMEPNESKEHKTNKENSNNSENAIRTHHRITQQQIKEVIPHDAGRSQKVAVQNLVYPGQEVALLGRTGAKRTVYQASSVLEQGLGSTCVGDDTNERSGVKNEEKSLNDKVMLSDELSGRDKEKVVVTTSTSPEQNIVVASVTNKPENWESFQSPNSSFYFTPDNIFEDRISPEEGAIESPVNVSSRNAHERSGQLESKTQQCVTPLNKSIPTLEKDDAKMKIESWKPCEISTQAERVTPRWSNRSTGRTMKGGAQPRPPHGEIEILPQSLSSGSTLTAAKPSMTAPKSVVKMPDDRECWEDEPLLRSRIPTQVQASSVNKRSACSSRGLGCYVIDVDTVLDVKKGPEKVFSCNSCSPQESRQKKEKVHNVRRSKRKSLPPDRFDACEGLAAGCALGFGAKSLTQKSENPGKKNNSTDEVDMAADAPCSIPRPSANNGKHAKRICSNSKNVTGSLGKASGGQSKPPLGTRCRKSQSKEKASSDSDNLRERKHQGSTSNGVSEDHLVSLGQGEWTQTEVLRLRNAHKQVNPKSSSFWEDVADKLETRSSSDCRDKWFSLIKTPAPRAGRKKEASTPPTLAETFVCSGQEDDIFNSTPMRGLFSFDGLPAVDAFQDAIGDLSHLEVGSAIKVSGTKKTGDAPGRPNKTYLKGMKREINKEARQKNINKKKCAKKIPPTKKNLSEKVTKGDVAMNCKLSPGGTLRVNTMIGGDNDSDEGDIFFDDEFVDD